MHSFRNPSFQKHFNFCLDKIAIICIFLLLWTPIIAQPQTPTVPLQPHPLPSSLAQWQPENTEDYFDQIETPNVGSLVWSQFPIQVYVERPTSAPQQWQEQVIETVLEWNSYLPLQVVETADTADIQIWHRRPPLEPGDLRASSAETRYQVFVKKIENNQQMLSHQFTIWLSPTQTGKYVKAAIRHEFGHALGIWGHSPVETDVMYFAQVQQPPPISVRDINTLKKIYQQPTRLGWPVSL
jgi:predicted Zn-dependent protease